MADNIISVKQIENRHDLVTKISQIGNNFEVASEKIAKNIKLEIDSEGIDALLGHLRLCGAIPEQYRHDSSEEKVYSKYTDIVIHEAFVAMGFSSLVLKVRADVADVECVNDDYSFVADAKAFRLSRTAKNQKDFKIQAMDGWKHGKPYAMLVSPYYQLPSRTSQIYQQASSRSVCICTYTHLSVLVRYASTKNQTSAMDLVHEIFKSVDAMNPSKDASIYWQIVNRKLLNFDKTLPSIWKDEKQAAIESINISKSEALRVLSKEREKIMRLTKEEAIQEVLKLSKINNKVKAINSLTDNDLLEVG